VKPFYWGVSTSAFQHEGGYNAPGQPLNNWFDWELSGRVEATGRAVDFWNRYDEDFARVRGLGLNAFRMGISWSRVQPSANPQERTPPAFDREALAGYGRILVRMREHGLEPLVTLHHFSHPHWLGTDVWLDPLAIEVYLDYVKETVLSLNRALLQAGQPAVQRWITINEPNMLVACTYLIEAFPSKRGRSFTAAASAYQNLLIAHVKAYRLIHELYRSNPEWGKPLVTFNNYCTDLYWMDKAAIDGLSAPSRGVEQEDLLDWLYHQASDFQEDLLQEELPFRRNLPYWLGLGLKELHNLLGPWLAKRNNARHFLKLLYERPEERPFDYIALDYYDPFAGHLFRLPRLEEFFMPQKNLRSWLANSLTTKWWDWQILPQGLNFFVRHYERTYPGLPLVIAENGMAQLRSRFNDLPWRGDGVSRSDYLRAYLEEVERMRRQGTALEGYFHWSLTDNYEWGTYSARFGLYEVNFDDPALERRECNSLGDCPARTYAECIRKQALL